MRPINSVGDYKCRGAQFQSPNTDRGDSKEVNPNDEYTTYATKNIDITPLETGGKEYAWANTMQADVTHKITCRWFSGVKPQHRILWSDRTFNIYSVVNVGEYNSKMIIMAKEVIV